MKIYLLTDSLSFKVDKKLLLLICRIIMSKIIFRKETKTIQAIQQVLKALNKNKMKKILNKRVINTNKFGI
jgi:hypothetical protein